MVDGKKTHWTLELSKICKEQQIILYALPTGSVRVHMQQAFKKLLKPLKCISTKENFICHINAVLQQDNLSDLIKNCFRKSGLYDYAEYHDDLHNYDAAASVVSGSNIGLTDESMQRYF